MKLLLTRTMREKLEENAQRVTAGDVARDDLQPVVKFINTNGAGAWLFTELHDGDRLYGLCDQGTGFPELGYRSLREMEQLRAVIWGRRTNFRAIERETPWSASGRSLSEFAEVARIEGEIVDRLPRREVA